jgi:hypothetical protein
MNWRDYILDNAWTWGGTVLVLLTLTGSTLYQATLVTALVVSVHLWLSTRGENDEHD